MKYNIMKYNIMKYRNIPSEYYEMFSYLFLVK